MSRVLIIGGHGKVALRLAPLLVARGDEVTAVVRNPNIKPRSRPPEPPPWSPTSNNSTWTGSRPC